MGNWLERFLEGAMIVFFALFGGAARFAIAPPAIRSLWNCLGSLIVAAFAGILTWQVMEGFEFSSQVVAAGVGIAGLLGDDVLQALLKLGKRLRNDPFVIIMRIWRERLYFLFATSGREEQWKNVPQIENIYRERENDIEQAEEEEKIRQAIRKIDKEKRKWDAVRSHGDPVHVALPRQSRRIKNYIIPKNRPPKEENAKRGGKEE